MRKTVSVVLGVILFGIGVFVANSAIGSGGLPSLYNQNRNTSIIPQNDHIGNVTLVARAENVSEPTSPPIPITGGSEQSQRAKKLSEIAGLDSDNPNPITPATTPAGQSIISPQPETAEQQVNPQDTAATNLSYVGQIKVVSLGKTALGEPTVLVRWFRPQELGLNIDSSSVTIRVERAPSPDGPWMSITDPLAESQAGYWWKATQLDTKPFYLRIIRINQGQEAISDLSQLIDLSTRLAGLPLENAPATPAGGSTASPIAETAAKLPAYQPLMASAPGQTPQTPIPTWTNSLQETNPPAPIATNSTGSQVASPSNENSEAGSRVPEMMAKNTSFSTSTPQEPGSTTSSMNTTQYNPTNYNNPNSPVIRGNAPATNGNSRTNPGVMTLNPIFTEGFGVFFPASRGRNQESTVPVSINSETGQLSPSVSADSSPTQKRSIFTPPHRNVVPPQTYPNEQTRQPMGGYGNAMGNPYMGAYNHNSAYPGNNYGQPNPMTISGMGNGFDMNGTNGMPTGNQTGAMGGPNDTGEIIYLDQSGNTIPNPYTNGNHQFGVPMGDGTFYQQ